jgi:hypothetical protein
MGKVSSGWVAVAALVLTAVWFWTQIQEWKMLGPGHDHTLQVLNFILTGLLWLLLVVAAVGFKRDANKAQATEIKRINQKADYEARIDSMKRDAVRNSDELQRAMSAQSEELVRKQEQIEEIRRSHERDIRDARAVVVYRAKWGMGGIRQMYSSDVTEAFKYFVARYRQQGAELFASEEIFGDAGYRGDKKQLWVRFSCPCSGQPIEHTFHEGELIDLERRCLDRLSSAT